MEQRAATERLAVVVIKAMGNGEDVDIPTPDGERDGFDARLAEPPAPLSPAMALMRELGLH